MPHVDGDITAVKINQDSYASEYLNKATLAETTARIRHSKSKATATRPLQERHNVEFAQTVYAAGEVPQASGKAYVVFEGEPGRTEIPRELAIALGSWLIATAGTNVDSLIGWES